MNTWIDKLINDYYKFLRDRTAIITDTGTDWQPSVHLLSALSTIILRYTSRKVMIKLFYRMTESL